MHYSQLGYIIHGYDVSARARRCIRPEAAECDKVYELHSQLHAVLPANQPPLLHVIFAGSRNTLSSFHISPFDQSVIIFVWKLSGKMMFQVRFPNHWMDKATCPDVEHCSAVSLLDTTGAGTDPFPGVRSLSGFK